MNRFEVLIQRRYIVYAEDVADAKTKGAKLAEGEVVWVRLAEPLGTGKPEVDLAPGEKAKKPVKE